MKKCTTFLMLITLLACCFSFVHADVVNQTVTGVYSNWSSNPTGYSNWNCYGYAIGAYQNIDPGSVCNYGVSYLNMTPAQFKAAIKQDLAALGYTNISEVSSAYYLQPGEWMIAAISGYWEPYQSYKNIDPAENLESIYEGIDYHFYVKYTNGGGWFHKMGTSSAIMKLKGNNTPSTIDRTDEYFTSSSNYVPATCHYVGSTLIYIKFQTGFPISLSNEDIS